MFDVNEIRKDFPCLKKTVRGKKLVFLDSAASAQKPLCVINAISEFYKNSYANVHRGLYLLSDEATYAYEESRKSVSKFLGAKNEQEIIFTRNATESINLVAATYGRKFLKKGDEVIVSEAEHHANLVPWQILRDEKGIVLKIMKIADDGSYIHDEFLKLLNDKTKLVAITHMSNVLGTIFPVEEITKLAHEKGAKVLIDGCQAAVHMPIDVSKINCDFYVFSGHKTYGPTGVGVLYGKKELLDIMPPYQCGGDMVASVSYEKAIWAEAPAKFEAGTPAFVQAKGLATALEYMENLGRENIAKHETELVNYAMNELSKIEGLRLIGTAKDKSGVVSFVVNNVHSSDVATLLDQMGIAVRTGHHCAQPLVERMGVSATIRASFAVYNDIDDIDALVVGIKKAISFF